MDIIRNVSVISLMSIVAYGFLVAHHDPSKTSTDSTILGNDCIHVKAPNTLDVFGLNSAYWTAVKLATGDVLQIGETAAEQADAAK